MVVWKTTSRSSKRPREFFEETGVAIGAVRLTAPCYRGTHSFSFDGATFISDSTFFAVPLDRVSVTFAGLGDGEAGNIVAADWWSPSDLAVGVPLSNDQLPEIARMAVAAVHKTAP